MSSEKIALGRLLPPRRVGGRDGSVRRIVGRLAELDQITHAKVRLRETRAGWKIEARS